MTKRVTARKGSRRVKRWLLNQKKSHKCAYCGETITAQTASLDHVKPIAKGGYTKRRNCVLTCKRCNSDKGALDVNVFKNKLMGKQKRRQYA